MSRINFFFFYFLVLQYSSKIIKIPFRVKEYTEKEKSSFMESLMKVDIITDISIGSPSQNFETLIQFNQYNFYISGSNTSNHKYDETKSSSYQKKEDPKIFHGEIFIKGQNSTEKIKIGDNKFNDFPFLLITEGKNNEISSIGLKPNTNIKSNKDINIIAQLKLAKIINSYTFTIIFNKKEEKKEQKGEIIIGGFPHEFNTEQFKAMNYYQTHLVERLSVFWDFQVDDIKVGLDVLYGTKTISIDIESNVIYGTREYLYFVNDTYFESYLQYKECWFEVASDQFNNKFDYYVCNKEFKPSFFPNLTFISKDFNASFVFTYRDLFIEKNNNYYFLVIFNQKRDTIYNWVLGKQFLEKYPFVFDQERKIIGYYTQVLPKKFNWKIFILIFVVCLVFIFGMIFGYSLIKKPRKKRANELLDDYDYLVQK